MLIIVSWSWTFDNEVNYKLSAHFITINIHFGTVIRQITIDSVCQQGILCVELMHILILYGWSQIHGTFPRHLVDWLQVIIVGSGYPPNYYNSENWPTYLNPQTTYILLLLY